MNNATIVAVLGLLGASLAQAANVSHFNFNEDTGAQRPLSSSTGAPILSGGVIQLGTFRSADPTSLINAFNGSPSEGTKQAILNDFINFGATSSVGTSYEGLYGGEKSVPILAGSEFIDKTIYTLIGNGSTLAASNQIALVRDDETFAADNPVAPARLADISAASSAILIGNPNGPGFTTLLGPATSSLSLAAVPEPMSAMLLLSGLGLMVRRRRA